MSDKVTVKMPSGETVELDRAEVIAAAEKFIVSHEAEALRLHEQMDKLRDEKDGHTRKISEFQAIIDSIRLPNLIPAGKIG